MGSFKIYKKLDWVLISIYLLFSIIGLLNIFSAVYEEGQGAILTFDTKYGMQLIWMLISYGVAFVILFLINPKFFSSTATIQYVIVAALLLYTIFLGTEVSGSKSWVSLGFIRFQPAELSKFTTSLMLASLWSRWGFSFKNWSNIVITLAVVFTPALLIVMQKESGTALLYTAFFITLYREGMSGWVIVVGAFEALLFLVTLAFSPFYALLLLVATLIVVRALMRKERLSKSLLPLLLLIPLYFSRQLGELPLLKPYNIPEEFFTVIGSLLILLFYFIHSIRAKIKKMWSLLLIFTASLILIFAVDYIFDNILQPHQRNRIENLVGINVDIKGAGYNVYQSKVAIGSGGFTGKGYLKGTQTKYNFVPEQSTDFIFCTIGEEWGFMGSLILIALYLLFIIRIYNLAEKQKDIFTRIFGYSLASIIALHFLINIGMTIGLMPVIGIPLPFISYGGSALLSFTLFLFVFIRLDLDRWR